MLSLWSGAASRLRVVFVATLLGAAGLAGVGAAPASAISCTESDLIAAVEAANANQDATTIALAPGCVYSFIGPYTSNAYRASWYGPSALPAIASDITIEGNGATIERARVAPPFRLLFVGADRTDDADTYRYATPGAGVLTLSDLTLSGGLAQGGDGATDFSGGGGGGGMGGAIFSQGAVTLERVTIAGNTARGGDGGDVSPSRRGGGAGGGIGASASDAAGGGFGGVFPRGAGDGGSGGVSDDGAGGGGGGFRGSEDGLAGRFGGVAGQGGGPRTGTGGAGGVYTNDFGAGGNGSGGGGEGARWETGGAGGDFGYGGGWGAGGGGGGVGGGGGGGGYHPENLGSGGGGGFGGGGGGGVIDSAADGADRRGGGGNGGFGGGGGGGEVVSGDISGGDGQGPGGVGLGGFGGGDGGGGDSPDVGGTGAGGGGGAGMGGGVFNHHGELAIANSTLTGNFAVGGLGGIPAQAGGSAGAPGDGLGGAIFNLNGQVTLDSATIASNLAGDGGALYNLGYLADETGDWFFPFPDHAYHSTAALTNSILADSTAASDVVSNAPATVSGALSNTVDSVVAAAAPNLNIVESRRNAGSGAFTGTPLTADPRLGALSDNGGPTQTHAITDTSPAFDAGATALTTDQRGSTRPQGVADDVGAFELQVIIKATPTMTNDAEPDTIALGDGSVSTKATLAGGSAPTGTITFTLYGPDDDDCNGVPAFAPTPVAVTGNGNYGSAAFTPTAQGVYHWVAWYSGDSNNNPAGPTACNDAAADVTVTPANKPPNCSAVTATPSVLKGDKRMTRVTLAGATDGDGDALTYTIDAVTQDEPVTNGFRGDTSFPDATGASGKTVSVRGEANPTGNGRVYRIAFTISDGKATCSPTAGRAGTTTAKVSVPTKKDQAAFDDGNLSSWNSFTGVLTP